jgi:hypothetical protein
LLANLVEGVSKCRQSNCVNGRALSCDHRPCHQLRPVKLYLENHAGSQSQNPFRDQNNLLSASSEKDIVIPAGIQSQVVESLSTCLDLLPRLHSDVPIWCLSLPRADGMLASFIFRVHIFCIRHRIKSAECESSTPILCLPLSWRSLFLICALPSFRLFVTVRLSVLS